MYWVILHCYSSLPNTAQVIERISRPPPALPGPKHIANRTPHLMGVLNVDQVGEQLSPLCSCPHREAGPNCTPHRHLMGVLNVNQVKEQLSPPCTCPHPSESQPCSATSPYGSTECRSSWGTVVPTMQVAEQQSASSSYRSTKCRSGQVTVVSTMQVADQQSPS